jgi:ABC-2 type transport system permease protein
MKTMKWLLRREFWEHKGAMFWAPVVVSALMVMFVTVSVVYSTAVGKFQNNITRVSENGHTTVTSSTSIGAAFNAMPEEKKQQLASTVADTYIIAGAPLFLILAAVIFFYCLSALNDERRDRSILFWKSLPVSDAETVLSKVLTAAVVAPLITIAVATFVSLLLLLIVGTAFAATGVNLFGMVLSNPALYLAPLQLLGMLPVYVLWAIPTIGWLLLVSAWAKSKVFLWAVGTPVITLVIIKWANYLLNMGIDLHWVIHNVVGRFLLGVIPGAYLGLAQVDKDLVINEQHVGMFGNVFKQSWLTLAQPGVWIAAIAGAAMIYGAIRLRRWKDEG